MITALVIALPAALCVAPAPSPDSTYQALYEGGTTFADFVAAADRRKEQWERNVAKGVAPDALVARAKAVPGNWRLLVITVPGCSDSVNSIPYLASFLEHVPGIEMRLVDRSAGLRVMEAHRTPDGRPATPTIILLDDRYAERGCWIERPHALIAWLADGKGKLGDAELFDGKMKWYDADRGASTLEEIVQMIESAAGGREKCGGS